MKINKKSWHYRYMNLIHTDRMIEEADNLCKYIRKFTATTILYVGFIGFIAGIGGVITGAWLNLPIGIVAWSCLPVGVLVSGIIAGLLYLVYKLNEWNTKRKNKKNNEKLKSGIKVEPNPFIQYVKDKHNKMCSFIEYED